MAADTPKNLRNVAIIAHVDHGKTTLVDAMLRQTGTFRSNEALQDRVMDSNALERERGITILAKQTSINYKGTRINIIDTPGHADFGGEVERTLRMADAALLLVDAAEGPLPQTRFVLGHALALQMPVIVVVNKIDRHDARPDEVVNEVFDLFCDLQASDAQTDFPVVYTIARDGICRATPDGDGNDLNLLFETILQRVPEPTGDAEKPFQFLVTNVEHDEYVGRLAVGRIVNGRVTKGGSVIRIAADGNKPERINVIFSYDGVKRTEREAATAGEVVALAGMEDVQIGDTVADSQDPIALPRIEIEQPTIKVRFHVNTSPMAGLSGKYVTSRHLGDRLRKEARTNLAMRFEETDEPDVFVVYGRGELMIAILVETMRREGYELALGNPEVVVKEVDGVKCEPSERVVVDVAEEFVGAVTSSLGQRRGRMEKMVNLGFGRARLEFVAPSRGLIGYRSQFLSETRGTGLLNTIFEAWEPSAGAMLRRLNGALVSDRAGSTTPYALFHLQPRGELFIDAGVDVYEGMVVGEHNRPNDLDVNACREKKLTNIRAAGRDENTILSTPRRLTIETAMEWIDRDELVEITPAAVRVRKKILAGGRRPKRSDDRE